MSVKRGNTVIVSSPAAAPGDVGHQPERRTDGETDTELLGLAHFAADYILR